MNTRLKRLQDIEQADHRGLQTFDRVLLSYARSQGLSGENELQRNVSRALLDNLILELEPEDWAAFNDIVPVLGELHTRELMRYSLERSLADVKEKRREIEQLLEEPDDDEPPTISKTRKKDRER